MSTTDKIIGGVKAVMLMQERFDGVDERIKRLDRDLSDLAESHSKLAQRVARIEGFVEGAAAGARQPQQRRIEDL